MTRAYWQDGQARVVARLATHMLSPMYRTVATNVPVVSGGRRLTGVPVVGRNVEGGYGGLAIYEFESDHPEMHSATIAQGQPMLSGGVPALYDGQHCSEFMYHYYPRLSTVTPGNAGALESLKTYQWRACYEWQDVRGVRHMSAPSAIRQSLLGAGNDSATFDISTLQLTEKYDVEAQGHPVAIVVYRTQADGSIFYREQSTALLNDLNADWIAYTSTAPDSDLPDREILYTDGGVLPNMQPPAFRHATTHERHLWGISRDNPKQIWVSKTLQPNQEMPGFPLEFVMQSESNHVALASLGTNLLALTEDGVYAYAGDPPNDLAQGGTLSGPHLVAQHTGCINPKSVVQCPNGVVFQSRDSFWMVDNSLQAKRVGGAVEDTVATYQFCTSAVLDQRRELILFTMTNGEDVYGGNPSLGVTLAWHYLLNEWTVWHYPSVTGGVSTAKGPGRGACMAYRGGSIARPEYHQVQTNGRVFYNDDGWMDHDANAISLQVSSPWLQFSGVAGFQRVRRAHLRGTYVGPHSVIVRAFYNFEPEDFAAYKSTAFDGSNDYVTMGDPAALDFISTGSFTLSCWFKTTDGSCSLISKAVAGATALGYDFKVSFTGKLWFVLARDYGGGDYIIASATPTVNDGKWHQAAIVYTPTTRTIYLDGAALPTTVTGTLTSTTVNAANFIVGSTAFAGNICHAAVWGSALTAAQMATVYNRGRPGDLASLAPLGWWYGDTYPSWNDYGSGNNDGTMTNMTSTDIVVDVPSGNSLWCFTDTMITSIVGSGTEEHIGIHLPRQKCEAVRFFVMADAIVPPTSGGLVRWETLAVEAAGKKGLFKLPLAARS